MTVDTREKQIGKLPRETTSHFWFKGCQEQPHCKHHPLI